VERKEAPPPKELAAGIAKLLEPVSLRVSNDKQELYAEIWLRANIPTKADPAKLVKGAAYEHLEGGDLVGAVRFSKPAGDYRKQIVPPGVYTLRYALQPQDGSHMGTAPHPEFVVVVAAALDKSPEILLTDDLNELSAKSIKKSHPGVFLLFPFGDKSLDSKITDEGKGHWVVRRLTSVTAQGRNFPIGFALVIAGHTQE